jgi:hypothetical protein
MFCQPAAFLAAFLTAGLPFFMARLAARIAWCSLKRYRFLARGWVFW